MQRQRIFPSRKSSIHWCQLTTKIANIHDYIFLIFSIYINVEEIFLGKTWKACEIYLTMNLFLVLYQNLLNAENLFTFEIKMSKVFSIPKSRSKPLNSIQSLSKLYQQFSDHLKMVWNCLKVDASMKALWWKLKNLKFKHVIQMLIQSLFKTEIELLLKKKILQVKL